MEEVKKSKFGTYFDIKESEYKTDVSIGVNVYTFYFTTKAKQNKFENGYIDYVNYRNTRENSLVPFKVNLAIFYLLKYYTQIQKSNFYFVITSSKGEEEHFDVTNTKIKTYLETI